MGSDSGHTLETVAVQSGRRVILELEFVCGERFESESSDSSELSFFTPVIFSDSLLLFTICVF